MRMKVKVMGVSMCVIQKLMLDQHLWPMQSERAELVALNNAGGEEYRYPRATLPDERTASPITMGRKTKAKAAKKKNEKVKAAKAASGEFLFPRGGPFVLDGRPPETGGRVLALLVVDSDGRRCCCCACLSGCALLSFGPEITGIWTGI